MNFTAGPVGAGDDFGHGTHVAADCAGYKGFAPQVPDSVSGKIALIQRGSTVSAQGQGTGLFSNKAAFVAAKGAIAALIYNNVNGELTAATVRKSPIQVLGISKANGEYLKSVIGSDAFGAVSSQQIRINKAPSFDPAMADFSSRGPVAGFGQVKPDVTAPGVAILSATIAQAAPRRTPPRCSTRLATSPLRAPASADQSPLAVRP